jgi:nucleoside-diphosphate kinase
MKGLIQYIKESQLEVNGFAILKPEFLDHEDDWKYLLSKKYGWDIVRYNKIKLSHNQAAELYKPHKDKDFYNDLCNYMCSDYCGCALLHKDCKDPIENMNKVKDVVRKQWGKDDMKNAMHSSDSLENVDRESKICFKENYEENK